ncbi:AAA family ATPase [Wolinella succinogenes]|uniref:AAA family ATPase n=1 Tax=Wolinella succinogenes TaxID=844 RepID=UPI0024092790|nr:AAA family ATPase [Wolinella succinogenes]
MHEAIIRLKNELQKALIGQESVVDALLIGLFTQGHILLEGVPGLAKTTAIKALSRALGLSFKRLQFTPDLLPSDILGAEVYNPKERDFYIKKGPIFAHLILADEINRAPAKVQSALLEAMQERQVTLGSESFALPEPFLVMATQNPIEQEGAYALPEAQLDRFMMKVEVGYGSYEEELLIAQIGSKNLWQQPRTLLGIEEIMRLGEAILRIHCDEEVERYMVDLVQATREPERYGLPKLKEKLRYGASPRGTIDLFKATKALAFLKGKDYVSPVDVAELLLPVLGHKITLSYVAKAEGITPRSILEEVLGAVKIP